MASYVDSSLTPGERVIYIGKISVWSLFPYLFLGVLTIWIFGLGILFFLYALTRYVTTELAVTNKRIIAKSGLISRETMELNLAKVESVQVHQGIWGRLLSFGSIVVSGTGNSQAPIHSIARPIEFRQALLSAQEEVLREIK